MSKLYIFGIGGTGSRVLKSLTMLLAAGVDMGDTSEIVPIIIDPDESNANLTQNIDLLKKYTELHNKLEFHGQNSNQFFKTPINQIIRNYTLRIKDTNDKTFREFIEFDAMSKANKAMTKMLFSDKNLQSDMKVGFKGNPNIGSVVLNQISSAAEFIEFANSFAQNDKIFIISSIFGGTGASGFPLLLKTLRTDDKIPNHANINNAQIGALTVLPYFKVEQNNQSEIESSTFIGKAKSALTYYENNIGSQVNSLYFIGDEVNSIYKNNEGGTNQNNDSHLIEFLGATAIVHFAKNGVSQQPQYYELGINNTDDRDAITFGSLHNGLKDMLYVPLTQFSLMAICMVYNCYWTYTSEKFAVNRKDEMKNFHKSQFYGNLVVFLREYVSWLEQMKANTRSLNLFNMQCDAKPFELVTDVPARKSGFFEKKDYDLISDKLNKKFTKLREPEDMFLEMFYLATKELIKEKLN